MRKPLIIFAVFAVLLQAGCGSLSSAERHRRADIEQERRDRLLLEEAQEQDAARRAEVDYFFEEHPQLTDTQRNAIKNGAIILGMPDYAVEFTLGKPDRRTDSVFTFGTRSQWAYGSYLYLYFENKVLTSFQKTE